jgi:hypothetical protein
MAWETIEAVKPQSASAVACPDDGVKVTSRSLGTRGGGVARYISLTIGAKLARGIALGAPEHKLRLMFGTGDDAGKIAVSVDQEAGRFLAKRNKRGGYALTINAATAEGLFSLTFPAFTVSRCEAIRPTNGQPPRFVFKASAEMLKVDDE